MRLRHRSLRNTHKRQKGGPSHAHIRTQGVKHIALFTWSIAQHNNSEIQYQISDRRETRGLHKQDPEVIFKWWATLPYRKYILAFGFVGKGNFFFYGPANTDFLRISGKNFQKCGKFPQLIILPEFRYGMQNAMRVYVQVLTTDTDLREC